MAAQESARQPATVLPPPPPPPPPRQQQQRQEQSQQQSQHVASRESEEDSEEESESDEDGFQVQLLAQDEDLVIDGCTVVDDLLVAQRIAQQESFLATELLKEEPCDDHRVAKRAAPTDKDVDKLLRLVRQTKKLTAKMGELPSQFDRVVSEDVRSACKAAASAMQQLSFPAEKMEEEDDDEDAAILEDDEPWQEATEGNPSALLAAVDLGSTSGSEAEDKVAAISENPHGHMLSAAEGSAVTMVLDTAIGEAEDDSIGPATPPLGQPLECDSTQRQKVPDATLATMLPAAEEDDEALQDFLQSSIQDPEDEDDGAPVIRTDNLPQQLKPDDEIELIGQVESCVQGLVVVKSTNGRILDLQSVVCTKGRVVLGVVMDVFGPVSQPLYLVYPTTTHQEETIIPGTRIFAASSLPETTFLCDTNCDVLALQRKLAQGCMDESGDDSNEDESSEEEEEGEREHLADEALEGLPPDLVAIARQQAGGGNGARERGKGKGKKGKGKKGKGKGKGKNRQEQPGHATYADHRAKIEHQESSLVKREGEGGALQCQQGDSTSAASAQPPQLLPPPPPPPARGGTHSGRGCSPACHMQSDGSKVKREGDRFQPEPGNGRGADSSNPAAAAPLAAAASAQPPQLPPPPPPPIQPAPTREGVLGDDDQGFRNRAIFDPSSAAILVQPRQVVSAAMQPRTSCPAMVRQAEEVPQVSRPGQSMSLEQQVPQVSSAHAVAASEVREPKLVLPPQRTLGGLQPPRAANVTTHPVLVQGPQQPRVVPTLNKQTAPAAKTLAPMSREGMKVVQNQTRSAPYPPQRVQPPPRAR